MPLVVQAPASRPSRWEILRLEDRQQKQGEIPASGETVKLDFAEAGSYTVSLRDAKGNLLAATSHWVSGEGMKAVPGSVEIVFDKEKYVTGETAHALITFPSPVDNALLTLERDRVEATALLGRSGGGNWLTLTQLAPALPANFLRWRYRDDRTHVSFHRLATLQWLATRFGFVLEQVESQAFLLRKQG